MTVEQYESIDTIIFEGEQEHKLTIVGEEETQETVDLSKVILEKDSSDLSIVLTDADNTISYTGEAQDKSESGDITIIANGEEATSSETINVSVENDGETSDAAEADYIYVFEEGEYSYTIENFEAGDVLDLPDSPSPTVNNDDWNDGEVEVQWAADGKVMTVTITGLGDE